ncbi:MAG: BlaI/MecI/CopY family transcriptional regulator [Thermoplasmata archaeon]|nr:BlaI/MecI/CopY family transcriptional regulator [Thermoplasmata archaeon]
MINKIENKIAEIMRHYGFGDCEAAIMASLATHGKMKAKEIAEKTGYAYSTVINALNFLRRTGFVTKEKEKKLCVYSTNLDFVKIIEEDRKRLSALLKSLKDEIIKAEGKYKEKLSSLVFKIESALNYLDKGVC